MDSIHNQRYEKSLWYFNHKNSNDQHSKNTHPAKIISSSLIGLPAPPNISSWWNLGALLGARLPVQI